MRMTVRFIRIWLALVIMALALACSADKNDPISYIPQVSNDPYGQEEPNRTEQPKETDEKFRLEEYAMDAENGLYDILPAFERKGKIMLHAGFAASGIIRVFSFNTQKTAIELEDFDLEKGSFYTRMSIPMTEPASSFYDIQYLSMDPPLLVNYLTEELFLFDAQCENYKKVDFTGRALDGFRWDGESLVFVDTEEGTINRRNHDSTEDVLYRTDFRYEMTGIYSFSKDMRYAAATAFDYIANQPVTLLIDLQKGECIGWKNGECYVSFSETGFSTLGRVDQWNSEKNEIEISFQTADDFFSDELYHVLHMEEQFLPNVITAEKGYFFIDWSGDYTMQHADLTGENITCAALSLNRYEKDTAEDWAEAGENQESFLYPLTTADSTDGRYLMTTVQRDTDIVGLILWDASQGQIIREKGMIMQDRLFEQKQEPAMHFGIFSEQADRIARTYGVTVLFGEQELVEPATHQIEPLNTERDAEQIKNALSILENVFEELPPGFFHVLYRDRAVKIIVELCGEIRSAGEDALDYPSAITSDIGRWKMMAFDVSYAEEMRYTIYHEISHMIDSYLNSDPMLDESVWSEAGWNAYNPTGFSYYYAYNDENGAPYDLVGSTEYTAGDENYGREDQQDKVYFVDIYSKTFPTEDRAVLFGTLMRDNEQDDILCCPHIFEKLVYYTETIRQSLDPEKTRWDEPTCWEIRVECLRQKILASE